MVLAWQRWDSSPASVALTEQEYFELLESAMGSDLAVISYLRGRLAARPRSQPPSFGQLLFPALYLDPSGTGFIHLEPRHSHRHLVALFQDHPRRVWTTNYDDLVEQAALEAGIRARTLDPSSRTENREFSVAHLHGYLAPARQRAPKRDPGAAPIVLAEDDYHAVASNVIGWTNREFFRLFDGYRVLILGMSLDDPNLRRVLQVTASQTLQTKKSARPPEPTHFAVMRSMSTDDLESLSVSCMNHLSDACEWRAWYWRQHSVELIELPTHESILPFLMRLRYESYGNRPGDLWRESAKVCARMNPWDGIRQGYARDRLTDIVQSLRTDFSVTDNDEIVEVGVFLLKPDGRTLELAFRGGSSRRSRPGHREFSADPDQPTGVAGRVFVSSDLVRIPRDHELYDYGLNAGYDSSSAQFAGIISVPIVDWERDGLPLGVIYVSTATVDGTLFNLPEKCPLGTNDLSLDDLYVWLHKWGLQLLVSML